MKNSEEKYFYGKEEDFAVVKMVRDDFLRRQEARKQIERGWELNLNFYLGNQYSYIASTGNVADIEKNFRWESREVYNHIAPIIECRLAKLNKIRPALMVRAASDNENDVSNAKIAKALIRSSFEKNGFDNLSGIANAWSEITGTAFYKVVYDSTKGEFVGENENGKVKNGDVTISVCSPFEIYPDSNGNTEVEDCESIIEARAYSASEVGSAYGVKLTGEEIDTFEMATQAVLSSVSGRSNSVKVLHSARPDTVLLIERYEKPSNANPKGRFTIVCKDKLLYDGDYPYVTTDGKGFYPFVKQVSTKQITNFWGISVIDRCIPLQKAYNALKNKKHEYITRLASGVLTVEDGSVDIDNLEEEGLAPGKILVYRNGSTPPSFLSPGHIPEEFEKEEVNLLSEMNNLCCVSDISVNSSFPRNVSSGSALSILIEQDESRLSLVGENIRIAVKKLGEKVLWLYKQFASGARIVKVANLNGSTDVLLWTGSDLGSDDVIFETANEFEESAIKQKETILALYEKGIFDDENGELSSASKKNLLEMLGVNGYHVEEDLKEVHCAHAITENRNIENLADPLELDDHEVHICEHLKFLYRDEKLKESLVMKQKLINHIIIHKNLNKKED